MASKQIIGKYRFDADIGQAVVTLSSPGGVRRTYRLGRWKSHDSLCKHEELVGAWKRSNRTLPDEIMSEEQNLEGATQQLRALTLAWPTLLPEVRGAIIFLAGLNRDIGRQKDMLRREWRGQQIPDREVPRPDDEGAEGVRTGRPAEQPLL